MNKYLEWLVYHKRQIIIIGGILVLFIILLGIGLWQFYFNLELEEGHNDDKKITLVDKSNSN